MTGWMDDIMEEIIDVEMTSTDVHSGDTAALH